MSGFTCGSTMPSWRGSTTSGHWAFAIPRRDLISAVQAKVQGMLSLRQIRREGDEWRSRADPDEVPPWLGLIAVSVLVVARESERGSLAFYRPLSDMLGLSSVLNQSDYEESFYKWWLDLARWLADSNAGSRGLPSWRRIPQTGPRCVVGHPYTQVLLRRDDFRDVDAFLLSLGHLEPGGLEITDAATAGTDLLERLRRWATHRRVSGRLWELLHGSHQDAGDSLPYMSSIACSTRLTLGAHESQTRSQPARHPRRLARATTAIRCDRTGLRRALGVEDHRDRGPDGWPARGRRPICHPDPRRLERTR